MDRLLILSCSQRKVSAAGRMPALDRYDGPAFRVLRKYLREGAPEAPTVLILSAKYGLIAAHRRIPAYDCRMSAARATELRSQGLAMARQILEPRRWREVGVCVGKEYRAALDGFLECVPAGTRVSFIGGGLGRRLTALRGWLRRAELRDGAVAPV